VAANHSAIPPILITANVFLHLTYFAEDGNETINHSFVKKS